MELFLLFCTEIKFPVKATNIIYIKYTQKHAIFLCMYCNFYTFCLNIFIFLMLWHVVDFVNSFLLGRGCVGRECYIKGKRLCKKQCYNCCCIKQRQQKICVTKKSIFHKCITQQHDPFVDYSAENRAMGCHFCVKI